MSIHDRGSEQLGEGCQKFSWRGAVFLAFGGGTKSLGMGGGSGGEYHKNFLHTFGGQIFFTFGAQIQKFCRLRRQILPWEGSVEHKFSVWGDRIFSSLGGGERGGILPHSPFLAHAYFCLDYIFLLQKKVCPPPLLLPSEGKKCPLPLEPVLGLGGIKNFEAFPL